MHLHAQTLIKLKETSKNLEGAIKATDHKGRKDLMILKHVREGDAAYKMMLAGPSELSVLLANDPSISGSHIYL